MAFNLKERLLNTIVSSKSYIEDPKKQIETVLLYIESLRNTEFEELHEKFQSSPVNFECLNSIYSSEGSFTALGFKDSIQIWDSSFEAPQICLRTFSRFVTSISISPDQIFLAYGSEEKSIKIWKIKEEKVIGLLKGHYYSVKSVTFAPDGKSLASGCVDGNLKLWDLSKMREIFTLKGHFKAINCLAFTSDGLNLASGSDDSKLKIWDLSEKTQKTSLEGHTAAINSICFRQDNLKIVSGSSDRCIIIWNLIDNSKEKVLDYHAGAVNCVMFWTYPFDKRLLVLSASDDCSIKIWDINENMVIESFQDESEIHAICAIKNISAVMSIDKNGVAKSRILRFNDFTLNGHTKYVNFVCEVPNSPLIVSGAGDNSVKIWNLLEDKETASLSGHSEPVYSVSVSPDSLYIASGSSDSNIKIWDLNLKKELITISGHSASVNSVCFSPNGLTLASGASDKLVKIWDFQAGSEIRSLEGHNDWVKCLCFSPDSSCLVSGSDDKTLIIWDLKGNNNAFTLNGHTGWINSVSFSPKGDCIASGSADFSIKVWDFLGKIEKFTLNGHSNSVNSVCFNFDGTLLISGSRDATVKVWDLLGKFVIFTIKEHSSSVNCVCFALEGTVLVSGSGDKTIKVWNLLQEPTLLSIPDINAPVSSILISSDSKFVKFQTEPSLPEQVFNLETQEKCENEPEITWVDFDGSKFSKKIENNTLKICVVGFKDKINATRVLNPKSIGRLSRNLTQTLSNTPLDFDQEYPKVFNPASMTFEILNKDPSKLDAVFYLMREDYSSLDPDTWQVSLTNLQFSPLHFAAYRGETPAIEVAVSKKQLKLSVDAFQRSPIFYSIIKKHQKIIDLLLEFLISIDESHPFFFENYDAVKNDLTFIIKNSPGLICQFLSMCIRSNNDPPQVGEAKIRCKFVQTRTTSFEDFLEVNSKVEEPLKLKYSAFDLPCTIGSSSSLRLLYSILLCKNKDIYKVALVQTYIKHKWDSLKPFTIFYTLLLWLNIFFMVAFIEGETFNLYFLIGFCVVNGILFTWEIFQMIQTGFAYFADYWNIIDVMRITITIIWLISKHKVIDLSALKLSWVVALFNLSRGVTGFRAFDTTRYYIRLILRSLYSISSFLLIFIYTTFSFGLLNGIFQGNLTFNMIWVASFGLAFGDSQYTETGDFDLPYLTYCAAVIINVVLMLNMIISILGDSFDEFQLYAVYYDGREMTQTIVEIEQVFSFFVKKNEKKYMHICMNYYEEAEETWPGKVIDIKDSIQSSCDKLLQNLRKDNENNTNKILQIEGKVNAIDQKLNVLIDLYSKNNKFT